MVILIMGASHTGKTLLAQKLLEIYKFPYLSIDHLKMGLIRSGNTTLTAEDDALLTDYMWPIIREMIKTVIENEQNIIVEGCYIPLDFAEAFDHEYLDKIKCLCLIMTEKYIKQHFSDIKKYSNVIECRLNDDCSLKTLIEDNTKNLDLAKKHNINYFLIDENYDLDLYLESLNLG